MIKFACDDCNKPLEEPPMITVNEIGFFVKAGPPRGYRDLHFCDKKCMTSWIVKTAEKPTIITSNGN